MFVVLDARVIEVYRDEVVKPNLSLGGSVRGRKILNR